MAFYQISLESYVIMPNGGGHLGFFINMKNKLSSIVSSFQFVSLREFKNILQSEHCVQICSNYVSPLLYPINPKEENFLKDRYNEVYRQRPSVKIPHNSYCLKFFHLLAQKPNLEKKNLFVQTNSFIIFTCPNPVLLVPGFRQVG
jgi:hypothetical protein